jgi:predicted nucleic acid-binding Zn ribbon protein
MAQAMRRCSVCRTLYPVGRRNRKTCSDKCRVTLAVMHDRERQAAILAASKKATAKPDGSVSQSDITARSAIARSLRVVQRPVAGNEPRRKCEVCCQRVRLINSVAGAVWLRQHQHNGQICDGSRAVVCYPYEREAEQCES